MKALKEKRVSLRSLFRRSLVILSLLALAFAVASCGGDSESDNPGGSGDSGSPGDSSVPEGERLSVKDLKVISHPNQPSYEGAYPNLSGIKVLVQWSDGTSTETSNPDLFTVYPPVAYITGSAGTHELLSPEGRYAIQYIGEDADYYSVNFRRPVYIPAVIAMDATAFTATTGTPPALITKLDGNFDKFYEDKGIEGDLYIISLYTPFDLATFSTMASSASITSPYDSGYPAYSTLIAGWTGFETSTTASTAELTKKSPISNNPEAWRLDVRQAVGGTVADAVYLANLNSNDTGTSGHIQELSKQVTAFYKVDKIEYLTGLDKIAPFAVDGDNSGTQNTTKAIGGTTSTSQGDWLNKLLSKGNDIKFNVYYLDDPKPREINMWDYYKAMYTLGKDSGGSGNMYAKATLPVLIGDPDFPTPSAVESLQEEYDLSLVLYYYNPGITGGRGQGVYSGTNTTYVEANGAILPVSKLLLKWDSTHEGGMWVDKKTDTAFPSQQEEDYGQPYILSGTTDILKGNTLYDNLQKYWKVGYWYTDTSGNQVKGDPVAWPTVTLGTDGLSPNDYGLIDAELEDAEGVDLDPRVATIGFPVPFSADPDRTDTIEKTFNFWMQRR